MVPIMPALMSFSILAASRWKALTRKPYGEVNLVITFRITPHTLRPGVNVIEVLNADGKCCATIVPSREDPNTIRIISAHFAAPDFLEFKSHYDDGTHNFPPIPCLEIEFDPRPYHIIAGK